MFNIRAFFFLGNAKQCGPIIQNHFTRRHLKRGIPTRLLILSYYYEGNVSLRSFRSLHFWGSLHHSWKSLQDCHWWVEMMDYQMDPLKKDCHWWVEMMDYQMDPLKDCHWVEMMDYQMDPLKDCHWVEMLDYQMDPLKDCHWVEMLDYQMDSLKDCHWWVEMMDYQMDPLKDCHDTDELNSSKSSFISLVLQMCIHLLRRDLSWVNNRISSLRAWITTHRRRRRK